MSHHAFIGVGSNLGSRSLNVHRAFQFLTRGEASLRVVRSSRLYETSSVGPNASRPLDGYNVHSNYLNCVFEVKTTLSPRDLRIQLRKMEEESGRDAAFKQFAGDSGPRPLDLDILFYFDSNNHHICLENENENENKDKDYVILPHPRLHLREFVLRPLHELCNTTHPLLNESISDLLHTATLTSRENGEICFPVSTGLLGRDEDVWQLQENLDHKSISISNSNSNSNSIVHPGLLNEHGRRTAIMGILNVTPDSFSDGGDNYTLPHAINTAKQMIEQGVDILDIGGESTRPGAPEVSLSDELSRVLPVIEALRADPMTSDIPISIDTMKAQVALQAVNAGADIVNDVSAGQHDPEMFSTIAGFQKPIPYIMMHRRGNSQTMQTPQYTHYNKTNDNGVGDKDGGVVDGVLSELRRSVVLAEDAGIARSRIVIDPGIGFAKTFAQNMDLIANLGMLEAVKELNGLPLLIGVSRKAFIGALLEERGKEKESEKEKEKESEKEKEKEGKVNNVAKERLNGTIGACVATVCNASRESSLILRVHDVKEVREAVKIADNIMLYE